MTDKTFHQPIPLILAPTAVEYAAVRRALGKRAASGEIRLGQCGMGVQRARSFCEKAPPGPFACLALVGWAGGLARDLAVGEIVSAEAAVMDGLPRLDCQVLDLPVARTGSILTVPKALMSEAEKRAAVEASGAVAVEMEAYPLAEWAQEQGIPFIHVRIIMDAWDEPLPDFAAGGSVWGRVRGLPGMAPRMWWMYQRIRMLDPLLEKMAGMVAEAMLKYVKAGVIISRTS